MTAKYDPSKMRARLKSVLDEKQISMRKASLASGNSESYLSGVIVKGRDPQLARLVSVCDYLGVSLSWVLYGFEVPEGSDEIFQLLAERPELAESVATLLRAPQTSVAPG